MWKVKKSGKSGRKFTWFFLDGCDGRSRYRSPSFRLDFFALVLVCEIAKGLNSVFSLSIALDFFFQVINADDFYRRRHFWTHWATLEWFWAGFQSVEFYLYILLHRRFVIRILPFYRPSSAILPFCQCLLNFYCSRSTVNVSWCDCCCNNRLFFYQTREIFWFGNLALNWRCSRHWVCCSSSFKWFTTVVHIWNKF